MPIRILSHRYASSPWDGQVGQPQGQDWHIGHDHQRNWLKSSHPLNWAMILGLVKVMWVTPFLPSPRNPASLSL